MTFKFKKIPPWVLLLLGTTTALIAAEVFVRLWNPSILQTSRTHPFYESERKKFCQYDATLGWAGIPDIKGSLKWIDFEHPVQHNQHGFRGKNYPFQRSDKKRIVVVGDSFVWGFGVNDQEIFTAQIENQLGDQWEIVNMGVSGYGTDQQIILWESLGQKWNPDHVFLFFTFVNDLYDNILPERYGYPKPIIRFKPDRSITLVNVPVPPPKKEETEVQYLKKPPISKPAQWFNHSSFFRLILAKLSTFPSLNTRFQKWRLIPIRQTGELTEVPLYQDQKELDVDSIYRHSEDLLRYLNGKVKERGANLTVFLVPSVIQVYPSYQSDFHRRFIGQNEGETDYYRPLRRLKKIGNRLKIRMIDLLPPFQKAGQRNPRLYYPVNMHWTSEGHRVVAETVISHIRR